MNHIHPRLTIMSSSVRPSTAGEPLTEADPSMVKPGSVWTCPDKAEVVIVVEVGDPSAGDDFAVIADGWVSCGIRGTVRTYSIESFLRDYPILVFTVADQ